MRRWKVWRQRWQKGNEMTYDPTDERSSAELYADIQKAVAADDPAGELTAALYNLGKDEPNLEGDK